MAGGTGGNGPSAAKPGQGIAVLWAGLDKVRQASAEVQAAPMLAKVGKAERLGEITGDLLKAIIMELAAQEARIERLEKGGKA